MISTKKLIKMARKWQKFATASRRRISWPRTNVANKGHFFIYANDGKRFMILVILILLCTPFTKSVSFNFTSFSQNEPKIQLLNDSSISDGVIHLTKYSPRQGSVGRAYYSSPVQLWDKNTKKLTDFTTHFSFIILCGYPPKCGDGLSFFLAPVNSTVPDNSTGSYLGLVSNQSYDDTTKNQFVAVEFDTYDNIWDPLYYDHVGINVNSIVSQSTVPWKSGLKNGLTANAWITYDSSTKNLSVFLTYAPNPVFRGESILSRTIDLTTVLPDKIQVGFSGSTGPNSESHNIVSWEFYTTLPHVNDGGPVHKSKAAKAGSLIVAMVGGIFVLLVLSGILLWCFCRRRWVLDQRNENDEIGFSEDNDGDFENGTGPRRFTFKELSKATNNFAAERKLGEGGFGGVYKGFLGDKGREIAVKRISSGSKQGKKEYVSEVKIISRLRHKNLVQLLGWFHNRAELLLVYEFMPNGSLDHYLYGSVRQVVLAWPVRFKVAHGLASALFYLHEQWEQCVVHRDIKSSNVMLDSNFNAKLGDFGLARLVDHDLSGPQTNVVAGTPGYIAPECAVTGKANKESDVYSFGVVALEIACGRRPVKLNENPSKVHMVDWVWSLYEKGILLEAIDERLEGAFDTNQIESLMVVGLWCCHSDYTQRPSIRQVVNVLNRDSPLPILPSQEPVPNYFVPPVNMDVSNNDSSSAYTGGTVGTQAQSSSQPVLAANTTPFLYEKVDVCDC